MTAEELRGLALAAVEQAAREAQTGPVQRTRALGFALAYLFAYSGGPRGNFDRCWKALALPQNGPAVMKALDGISATLREAPGTVIDSRPWRAKLLPDQT